VHRREYDAQELEDGLDAERQQNKVADLEHDFHPIRVEWQEGDRLNRAEVGHLARELSVHVADGD